MRTLDKVTARTETFNVKVGDTVRFGPIYIKVRSCRKSPPIEKPEAASFLQIWEIDFDQKVNWIFSGWMFASTPALSSMDHAVYDVWILDCVDGSAEMSETVDEDEVSEEDLKKAAVQQGIADYKQELNAIPDPDFDTIRTDESAAEVKGSAFDDLINKTTAPND
jgi:hypothetical protein